MTIPIGVLCTNGVVIGADSSATFTISPQLPTIEQPFAEKIEIIDRNVIVASTGEFGFGQRFTEIVRRACQNKLFHAGAHPVQVCNELARLGVQDFQHTFVSQLEYGALVAFPMSTQWHLCEFAYGTMQPELKTKALWYVSMGSGQSLIDPFLALMRQTFWHDGAPSCEDAVFVVAWALQHAIQFNTGGINAPARVAILTGNPRGQLCARMLEEDEMGQHLQNVDGAIKYLREYPTLYVSNQTLRHRPP